MPDGEKVFMNSMGVLMTVLIDCICPSVLHGFARKLIYDVIIDYFNRINLGVRITLEHSHSQSVNL